MKTSATTAHDLDLALIGNCRVGALVNRQARIVWWCFPRFDSDPIFSRLLAGDEEKGFCDIVLADCVETSSQYLRNTAIVETILRGRRMAAGARDRFRAALRAFRARCSARRRSFAASSRWLGLPRIKIRVRPTFYGRPTTRLTSIGSNHIRYMRRHRGPAADRPTRRSPISRRRPRSP